MKTDKDEMLSEYNLTGKKGVRGKYAAAYRKGHTVKVLKDDVVVSETFFAAIDPDVHEYFSNSKAVNKVLRSIISSIPDSIRHSSKRS